MTGESLVTRDEEPAVGVNLAEAAGTYRVTAKNGISTDAGEFEEGAVMSLGADVARALLNEGSVEEVRP